MRLIQGLGQIAIILAVFRAAELLDRRQLILGEVELALDDIGFAEILAHLGIIRIEGDRLQVVVDPLVRAPELAGGVAAVVQRARRVGVVERVEDVERLLVALGLGKRIGVFGQFRDRAGRRCASSGTCDFSHSIPGPDRRW